MAVVGSINRRQSVGACIPILVSWYESEEDGMGKHLQPSLLKKEEDDNEHSHSAVYRIYSTININRLRED